WNTSEERHTPYTHSDLVSPSPSDSNGVTYTSKIPESTNDTPKTHTFRRGSIHQGGGVSDLADNHRPFFPQEVSNNGQETAGDWIYDLAPTGTHSYSDTHTSSTLKAHMDTQWILSSEHSLAQTSTKILSSSLPLLNRGTDVSSQNIQSTNQMFSKSELFSQSISGKATTMTVESWGKMKGSKNIGLNQSQATSWSSNTIPEDNQPETLRTDRSPRSTSQNHRNFHQTVYGNSVITGSTPASIKFPHVNQTNLLAFSDNATGNSPISSSTSEPPIKSTTNLEHTSSNNIHTSQKNSASEALVTQISHTIQSHHLETSSAPKSDLESRDFYRSTVYTTFSTTIPPVLKGNQNSPEPNEGLSSASRECVGLECFSKLPSTVQEEQEPTITSPASNPWFRLGVTNRIVEDGTATNYDKSTDIEGLRVSPSEVQKSQTHAGLSTYTPTPPNLSLSSEIGQGNVVFNEVTNIDKLSSDHTASRSAMGPTQAKTANDFTVITSSDTTTSWISKTDQTSPPGTPFQDTLHNFGVDLITVATPQINLHTTFTETHSIQGHTEPQPRTVTPSQNRTANWFLIQSRAQTILPQTVPQTSQIHSTAPSIGQKWPQGLHYFIAKDQPVIIKEDTFQVLLQMVLEEDYAPGMRLLEVETFLQKVAGFRNQHVIWNSGPVLQTIVQFGTVQSISWLGRAQSLLQVAELNPLPQNGVFVGGVRVKNITIGGLRSNICEWLLECPLGFQCVLSKGNATCTSVCHSEYCKHQGICVHRLGHQPICQCPVGDDFWFMGPRCDLRMTQLRLAGFCLAVLATMASVMALVAYLAVRRFKSMLMQAKVEQTRSSYRRFNHFDELSARFWGRSWPGSEDSLENRAFTRSDELLHMRALDRTCCYHDDTLSVVSTYHGSANHLNTVYPRSSQYGWDLSNCSLADGVVDSGKASDLSVCSWPIEPIQWTPFPLLQQLSRNRPPVKASRTRSYCEGMELTGLEKSWTA
ncbi:hypothetical protein DNTS_017155, partial [Danionella cerebrum]